MRIRLTFKYYCFTYLEFAIVNAGHIRQNEVKPKRYTELRLDLSRGLEGLWSGRNTFFSVGGCYWLYVLYFHGNSTRILCVFFQYIFKADHDHKSWVLELEFSGLSGVSRRVSTFSSLYDQGRGDWRRTRNIFLSSIFLGENITFATSFNVTFVRIYRWHFDSAYFMNSWPFHCRYVSESRSVRISTQCSKIRRKWRSCNFQIETRANYWITVVPACVFSHLACSWLSCNIRRSFSTPSPTPTKARRNHKVSFKLKLYIYLYL